MSNSVRVLHVDDDLRFGDMVAEFLGRENERFSIETATSAGEGLDLIEDDPPDCVVSDYNMPDMNGIEFLEAARAEYPDLPFILFTGKGSEEVASDAITAGATDYLQKQSGSDRYELLANRIENAVEQYRAKRRTRLSHRAMDTTNEGLSLVEPDGTFSYVNPAFAELFEYDPEELVDEHWTVLYHNDAAERLENDILPAVLEHGYWSGETVRSTKHGDRLVTDHRLSHTAEDVIVCTAQDVTPERTGSGETRSEFELAVDALDGHASYTLDHEGYITRWNEGAERLTGHAASDVVGEHFGRFFPEGEREAGRPEELLEAAKTGGSVTDRGARVQANGERFECVQTLSATYDAAGTIRGFGVIVRQATADPLARELRRTKRYLDAVLEHTRQPMFVKDADGAYLLANREYERLFDLQHETVVGRTDHDLHSSAVADEVRGNDRRVLEDDEPYEFEERVVVDGEDRLYLSWKVPVHFDDESGDPDAVFGTARDITP